MISMMVGIFEDHKIRNFYPLTLLRPIYDLRVGIKTNRERIVKSFEHDVVCVYMREYLKDLYNLKYGSEEEEYLINKEGELDSETILINGRLVLNKKTRENLKKFIEKDNIIVLSGGDIVLIKITESVARKIENFLLKPLDEKKVKELKKIIVNHVEIPRKSIAMPEYLWDMVNMNADLIREDLEERYVGKEWRAKYVDERVAILGEERLVYLDEGVEVEPYVVFNTKSGPIYVGKDTRIQAGARIEGPTYIGQKSIVVGGAQIREGSNLGDVCRAGGELEETIVLGYTNKYHLGFIGHSYIGEWVNIGAATNNSDLKDTYGTVRVTIRGRRIDTGILKVGCFIGDMVKTSIGVQIYTGKNIGVSSHLHGIVYEDVPSFTIYAKSLGVEPVELILESAIETQRRMMSRRGLTLTREEIEVIRKVYEMTMEDRKQAGVKKKRFKLP